MCVVASGLLESLAFGRDSYDAGAPVGWVALAGDVPDAFEVAEELVDGLLGDLELIGELGWALPVDAGVARFPMWAAVMSS